MRWFLLLILIAGLGLLSGCSAEKPEPETSWRDQALADPVGFNPKMEKNDISGGGLTDFDKKAFKKDVDHVLSP